MTPQQRLVYDMLVAHGMDQFRKVERIDFTFNGLAPLPEGTSPLQRPGYFALPDRATGVATHDVHRDTGVPGDQA